MIVSDGPKSINQRREYYLQIMDKAKKLNDQLLIKLIVKKLAHLSITNAVSARNGCIIVPFPNARDSVTFKEDKRPGWWMLIKLSLAIPGSLIALLLLAYYRWGPGVSGVY
jgi:hypothetical protein